MNNKAHTNCVFFDSINLVVIMLSFLHIFMFLTTISVPSIKSLLISSIKILFALFCHYKPGHNKIYSILVTNIDLKRLLVLFFSVRMGTFPNTFPFTSESEAPTVQTIIFERFFAYSIFEPSSRCSFFISFFPIYHRDLF